MGTTDKTDTTKPTFEPLLIMGYFWAVFGVVVLIASFFIEETPYVPYSRGLLINIIAGSVLVAVGLISVYKGRRKHLIAKERH
ncbi:MAG: hypothetical protein ACOY90_14975 [Candidatus Zhuqueibacterota bacterium]